jgi:LDH2 family malate/lactate/ureidoglycolate dehydrogenase
MSDPVISLTEVHDIATRILRNHGVSAEQTRAVADTVTNAERDECKSHGLFRIPGYLKSVKSGKVDGQAVPAINDIRPGVVHVDAKMGFAPLALEVGAVPLAKKARALGVAALAITDCHHFAALWPETERLAEQGLVAFAFTGSNSFVAPAGGTKPLFGTNPMAFAWPRENAHPVVFDQASSASARGEIQLHLRDGHAIPDGWAIDAEGQPTNDAAAALKGAQLPFGGYKGGAIALMVELLAGALIGDLLSFETSAQDNGDGGPPTGGEFMIAIDPTATRVGASGSAAAHAESLFARILEQDGTRLPSDRRYSARERTATGGVTVAKVLHDELQTLLNATT